VGSYFLAATSGIEAHPCVMGQVAAKILRGKSVVEVGLISHTVEGSIPSPATKKLKIIVKKLAFCNKMLYICI
jgi:hypothetical protein